VGLDFESSTPINGGRESVSRISGEEGGLERLLTETRTFPETIWFSGSRKSERQVV